MRERHILWDIMTIGLLGVLVVVGLIVMIQNERGWKFLVDQTEHSKEITSQNQKILNKLTEESEHTKELASQNREILDALNSGVKIKNLPAITIAPNTSTGTATGSGVATETSVANDTADTIKTLDGHIVKSVGGRLYAGLDAPKFERGDEHAEDGDTLVLNIGSEPNSLNPIIDNDATASTLFGRANDSLVERSFDDYKYWQPKLANAWEKSMICRSIAAKRNAGELADKLNAAWNSAQKKALSVIKIEAESPDILRIELSDVNNDYRAEALKVLGPDAIAKQYWIYVTYDGDKFSDGDEVNGDSVSQRLRRAIEGDAAFKGSFMPPWKRDSSVVVMLTGNGDVAEKAVKAYVDSSANSGEIADPKAASGKRTGKILTYDLTEDYSFEEKPVFSFHLRKDVHWHDGQQFSGNDVVFSFNTIMNPKIECPQQRNYYQDCESCKLVNGDPFTIQFVWKKPYFLAFVQSAEMTILPEHVYKFTDPEQFNKGLQNQKLVGNGAYRLESWERKKQFVFVRNEDYYGHKPHFNRIIYKLVEDRAVGLKMLQAGELDVQGLTKAQAKQYKDDPEFLKKWDINISVANVYRYIGWNARRPLFASAKVRRALTMLVDRKRVVEDIYRGFALPLNGPCHPDSPVYTKDLDRLALPFDVSEAARILKEDGWTKGGDNILQKDGQRFAFTLMFVSASPEYESVGNLVKDTFAQVGIEVTLQNLEWSVLLQKVERLEFDAVILGWALGLDDDPYQLWHSSQTGEKGSNHCYFVNKEADRLISEGRRELNDEKRTKMFQRVNEIIVQEQPYTFLLVEKRTTAYDRRIHNVVFKLTGSEAERWWVPKALQKYKE